MDPQTCTIILLKQTNPFYISDNDEDTTVALLKSVFGHGKNLIVIYNKTKSLILSFCLISFPIIFTFFFIALFFPCPK